MSSKMNAVFDAFLPRRPTKRPAALVNGLMALSIPKDRRANINRGLQAGEFLVSVTGNAEEVAAAREIFQNSGEIELETHVAAEAAWSGGEGSEARRKKHSSS